MFSPVYKLVTFKAGNRLLRSKICFKDWNSQRILFIDNKITTINTIKACSTVL